MGKWKGKTATYLTMTITIPIAGTTASRTVAT